MKLPALSDVVDCLTRAYGEPKPPPVSDPFELILLENVAYLVDDDRRLYAFENLRKTIGTRPEDILTALPEQFASVVALAGSDKKGRVGKLIRAAEIAIKEFDGDLRSAVDKLPFKKAVAALMKFPSIGEPGAEKILLFCGISEVLPLESNGLRVLVRIGYGKESANYSTMYKSVRESISDEIVNKSQWLTAGHLLLRQHGQTICKRTKPICDQCVLVVECNYGRHKARLSERRTVI